MNNDSAPTSAPAPRQPTSTSEPIAASEARPDDAPASDTEQYPVQPQTPQTPAQLRAQAQFKKKYEFVNSLMTNLDLIIYAELCVLYYLDCSFFRLIIRVLNQMVFLSPKPSFIPPMPQHRPYIGAIFGPNVICMLLHIFTARPEAQEVMRGYLHGGIIIDLIGQKGPTSKMHLLLLDLLVLGLQCFMLTVHVERERLSVLLASLLKPKASSDQPRSEEVSRQNLDAEERGVISEEAIVSPHSMPGTFGSNVEEEPVDTERARLLDELQPTDDLPDDSPLDLLWSGSAIVSEFHIIDTLKKQWNDYGNASASALQTVGFSAQFATDTANRRLNAASERLQRGVESLAG